MTKITDTSSDLYKCSKISELIPGLVGSITELEKLHELYQLNLDLKTSKHKFEAIAPVKESLTESEMEEFRERLYEALTSLGSGIKTTDLTTLDEDQRVGLVNILADIASYQDDINRIASK